MADLLYVTQSDVADLEHVRIVVVSWVSVIYRSHLVVAIQILHDGPPCGLYVASSSPVAAENLSDPCMKYAKIGGRTSRPRER